MLISYSERHFEQLLAKRSLPRQAGRYGILEADNLDDHGARDGCRLHGDIPDCSVPDHKLVHDVGMLW